MRNMRHVVNSLFLGTVIGLENIPKPPFILACNHVSIPDGWLLGNLMILEFNQTPYFIVRDDFWLNRTWTLYISKKLTGLPIDWRNPSQVVEESLDILKQNGIIGIFPEATRNAHEEILLKGKTGTARLAHWSGCPVVPVGYFGPAIATTWQAINHFVLHRRLAKIVFGKPVQFEHLECDHTTKETLYKTTDKIMIEIGKLCKKRPQLHY
jgi:1-acyl-sn-glycerol-3-phosphate acyltransferase